ncbi:hypothetical protein [Streptomyces sp. NPDC091268]|uniref:hypothetical protein n=1 Tax=Streptomyces sp. NPDC091268 TaxID=3365979 RepID=UPI0037FEF12C
MKPYTARVQFLGPLAILTLCPDPLAAAPGCDPRLLGRALALVPPAVRFLVLDVGGLGLPDRDTAPLVALVRAEAARRSAHLATIGERAALGRPGPRPSRYVPPSAAAGRDAEYDTLRRNVEARVLEQRAEGIRRARAADGHPCA